MTKRNLQISTHLYKKFFFEMGKEKIEEFIENIHIAPDYNKQGEEMRQAILEDVNKKIDAYERKNRYLKIFSVAASLLICLSIGAGWLFLKEKEPVMVSVATAEGEMLSLTLPDGSLVTLNSQSSLSYAEDFKGAERTVVLDGEALFDVVKDKEKCFVVKSDTVSVCVYGTKFNVQAYDSNENVEVSLLEGNVKVKAMERQAELQPGEQAVFNRNTFEMKKAKVDVNAFASWKSGRIYFKDRPFSEITSLLERKFGQKVYIMSDALKKVRFSGDFSESETLENILKVFTFDGRISMEKKNDGIYLYAKE